MSPGSKCNAWASGPGPGSAVVIAAEGCRQFRPFTQACDLGRADFEFGRASDRVPFVIGQEVGACFCIVQGCPNAAGAHLA